MKAPFKLLWFTDNTFEVPSRHGRGPAPLFKDGILFVEGMHGVAAENAYNGRPLWEFRIPDVLKPYDQEHLVGVAGTGSNFCVSEGSVYVHDWERCYRLDASTGEKTGEFLPPNTAAGEPGKWGYLASEEGILYGSVINEDHIVKWAFGKSKMERIFTESSRLFAMDPETGSRKWTYKAQDSIRHNAIAIGGGKVYLIDRPLALFDQKGTEENVHPSGVLLALDSNTGKVVWEQGEDVYGTMLALSIQHDVLLMTYQSTRFKLKSELGGRMAGYRASDGQRLWDVKAKYISRPLINNRTIYAEPGAWDLLTGERRDFKFSRSYGCGTISGGANLLAFRSATLGYLDLLSDGETENYGGIRPGCWINTIPAGGLLLMPEAANRCICSYLIKANIALQGKTEEPSY